MRRAGLDYWPQVDPRVWKSWEALEAEMPSLWGAVFSLAGGRTGDLGRAVPGTAGARLWLRDLRTVPPHPRAICRPAPFASHEERDPAIVEPLDIGGNRLVRGAPPAPGLGEKITVEAQRRRAKQCAETPPQETAKRSHGTPEPRRNQESGPRPIESVEGCLRRFNAKAQRRKEKPGTHPIRTVADRIRGRAISGNLTQRRRDDRRTPPLC